MSPAGTARCGHVVVATHGEPEALRVSSLDYRLDVTGNPFADAEGWIRGTSSGPT